MFYCSFLVFFLQVSAGERLCACARVTTWKCQTNAVSVYLAPLPLQSPATLTARLGMCFPELNNECETRVHTDC